MNAFKALGKFFLFLTTLFAAALLYFHLEGPVDFDHVKGLSSYKQQVIDIKARKDGFLINRVEATRNCKVTVPALANGPVTLNKGDTLRIFITDAPHSYCDLTEVIPYSYYDVAYPMYNWSDLVPGILSYF